LFPPPQENSKGCKISNIFTALRGEKKRGLPKKTRFIAKKATKKFSKKHLPTLFGVLNMDGEKRGKYYTTNLTFYLF